MKRRILILLLGALLINCDKSGEFLPVPENAGKACFESRPVLQRADRLNGTVRFSADLNRYFIYRAVPGTYDSVWNGFVCNLPDEYKVVGKEVTFSGEYRDGSDLAKPTFGGEEIYYLFLTHIQ